MKVEHIGSNQTVISGYSYQVLFSYNTPVVIHDIKEGLYLRTERKYTVTTRKHIGSFLSKIPDSRIKRIPQEAIEHLVNLM